MLLLLLVLLLFNQSAQAAEKLHVEEVAVLIAENEALRASGRLT